MQDIKRFVQAEEIANKLAVPRHFVSKILKNLVKAGLITSSKGKAGGFTINPETKRLSLLKLFQLIDGYGSLEHCALRLQHCNTINPCPIHHQMAGVRRGITDLLSSTTIGDLLKDDKEEFIKSIATSAIHNLSSENITT